MDLNPYQSPTDGPRKPSGLNLQGIIGAAFFSFILVLLFLSLISALLRVTGVVPMIR